jgi:uncharacterized membrane protein
MQKVFKFITPQNVLLVFVVLILSGAFLAPVFKAMGLLTLAKILYFIYSLFCHQIHYRSLHVFDNQYAWCTRDTFIWLGVLITGIYIKIFKVKGLKWYQAIPFVLPIALDGGIQMIATMSGIASDKSEVFYASTNFSRMVTGGFLGIGVGLFVFPMLDLMYEQVKEKPNHIISKLRKKIIAVPLIFSTLFVIYLGLIGLWAVTSDEYKPKNVIDLANRFPDDKDEWLVRRERGMCPAGPDDGFLGLNCKK